MFKNFTKEIENEKKITIVGKITSVRTTKDGKFSFAKILTLDENDNDIYLDLNSMFGTINSERIKEGKKPFKNGDFVELVGFYKEKLARRKVKRLIDGKETEINEVITDKNGNEIWNKRIVGISNINYFYKNEKETKGSE